ncbi:MAG: site-specific integrase, partial [Gammaproteobacteria bacterium]|nr:site-specific integrase [Gammaproteobacteria bacterium]
MDSVEWQLAEDFFRHLRNERRLSPHTVAAYRRDLVCLREFCERQEISQWTDLRVHNVRRYAAQAFAGGLSPRSVQRRLSGARMFMQYLVREGRARNNPVVDVAAPKVPRHLPGTLDIEQMTALLQVPGQAPVDKRDRAIMELLYSSGLRLGELVGLDVHAVQAGDGTVRVLGKGSKERVVPVGRYALVAINEWLAVRSELA